MRPETANDPTATQLNERIGTAHGAIDDGLVKNFRGAFLVMCPANHGGNQCFGLAGDAASVPVGNSNVARMAQTAESGDAVCSLG